MIGILAILLGCIGQMLFYAQRLWGAPGWVSTIVFLLPWFVLFAMNFLRVSPFSFTTHFRICLAAMLWWALVTVATEIAATVPLIPRLDPTRMIVAQILMNLGWLGAIPLWRMYKRG